MSAISTPKVSPTSKHADLFNIDLKKLRTHHSPASISSISSKHKPSSLLERVVIARQAKLSLNIPIDTCFSPNELTSKSTRAYEPLSSGPVIALKPLDIPKKLNTESNNEYMLHTDTTRLRSEHATSRKGSFFVPKRNLIKTEGDLTKQDIKHAVVKNRTVTAGFMEGQSEKQTKLEEFLNNVQGLEEVKAIAEQAYDEELKECMQTKNVKEFINIQKSRVGNVLLVLDKALEDKLKKEPKINQELWIMLLREISRIRAMYEEFLSVLDPYPNAVVRESSSSRRSKDSKYSDDIWKALNVLVEYSMLYRLNLSDVNISKEKDLEQLRQTLFNYKLDFKSQRVYDPLALKVFDKVENHINYLNQVIDRETERLDSIMVQHKKLLQGYQEMEGKSNYIKDDVLKAIEDMKKNKRVKEEVGLPLFQQKYLQTLVEELQAKNVKLVGDVEEYKQLLASNREKFNSLQTKYSMKVKSCVDKGVMTNFNGDPTPGPMALRLSTYFIKPDLTTKGNKLSTKIAFAMINAIYSDKMIMDIADDLDRRPRKPLADYTLQWFLKKFGTYTFCEPMIQDFLFTVSSYQPSDVRFRLFKELIGFKHYLDFDPFDVGLEKDAALDKKRMKPLCYKTAHILGRLFKIINSLKTAGDKGKGPKTFYGPLLPFSDDEDNIVTIEIAKQKLNAVYAEDQYTADEISIIDEHFQLIQQHDLYNRIAAKQQATKTSDVYINTNIIAIDTYLKFLLEVIVSKDIKAIESCYTIIRVNMASMSEINITYDEYSHGIKKFMPTATQSWRERTFSRLLDEPGAGKATLHALMYNFVHCYYQEDKAKEIETPETKGKESSIAVIEERTGTRKVTFKGQSQPQVQPHAQTQGRLEKIRKKAENLCKDVFDFGHAPSSELAYELYDTVSSLILLQETYGMVKPNIVNMEKNHERLMYLHYEFSTEIEDLLSEINPLKLESFTGYGKKELVCILEFLWDKLRQMLGCLYKAK